MQWHVCALAFVSCARLMPIFSHCLVAVRSSRDTGAQHDLGADRRCGCGASARSRLQLEALDVVQHEHGGVGKVRFSLPRSTPAAAVGRALGRLTSGLQRGAARHELSQPRWSDKPSAAIARRSSRLRFPYRRKATNPVYRVVFAICFHIEYSKLTRLTRPPSVN